MKLLYNFLVIALATISFSSFANENPESKAPNANPRVVVSYVVGQFVELEQQKDGSFKVTKLVEEKNPIVFKDNAITMSDEDLKKKVVAAIEQKTLKQGDDVTLGKGADLGNLVGGVAGAAGTVVGVVGAVVPHIEQIAGVVVGIAKFL